MSRGGYRSNSGRPPGVKNGQGTSGNRRAKYAMRAAAGTQALADMLGVETSALLESIEDASADPDAPKVEASGTNQSPLEYGLSVMRDPRVEPDRRDRMCIALLPYLHKRIADQRPTVKELKEQRAKEATGSVNKFAPSAPPRLVVNN